MRERVGRYCAGTLAAAMLSAIVMRPAWASEASEASGLADLLAGKGDAQPFKEWGIKWGGWLNANVTYNSNNNPDNFNGPVTFGDRSDTMQLNQAYVWLQRAVEVSGDAWDFGARADFMYGTDAIFTQAFGVPAYELGSGQRLNRGNWDLHITSWDNRFYAIALPQAYVEVNAPLGTGLDVKIGHFYTPVGYEVVTAPDNFFFTKPYTFQYGEPFTHTGLLANYNIDDNWLVMAGTVTGSATGGWDGAFNVQLNNWAFLGGAGWTSTDKDYSFLVTSTAGPRSAQEPDAWAILSMVGKANFLDNTLHYIIQHDHGWADNVMTPSSGARLDDAQWYGINQYLLYDIQEDLGVGIRGEWFRDQDGFRVAGPARCGLGNNYNGAGELSSFTCSAGNIAAYPLGGNSYYAVTAGLLYKPIPWLSIRPNVRYDWSDNLKVFNTGTSTDQFLFSTDMVVSF